MKSRIAFTLAAFLAGANLAADEPLAWPRFRGPEGSGIAASQKPPVELGPERNVRWKVPVPGGFSSPIVAGDQLIITAFEGGKLYTAAYRRADGKETWRAEAAATQLEAFLKSEGSPAASTPVTDGRRIVSYFGSCGLLCYDLAGKRLWRFEMPAAVTSGDFGSGVSPIIAGGAAILVRDEMKDPKIIAIDIATGEVKWERKRLSRTSWSTPVVWDTPAGPQVVAAGHARMTGYDLRSGEEKWFVTGLPSGCCSSPVTADGLIYFAGSLPGGPNDDGFQMPAFDSLLADLDADKDGILSRGEADKAFEGFFDSHDRDKDGKITRDEWDALIGIIAEGRDGAFALRPGGGGDVTESNIVWRQTRGLPYIPSAIVYRGQCVVVKDGGIVTSYDAATGAVVYQERAAAGGRYYASPVAADGRIYFADLDGAITVIEAGAKQPVVAARNPKLDERIAATPAIADDTLYVRTEKHLYAFTEMK